MSGNVTSEDLKIIEDVYLTEEENLVLAMRRLEIEKLLNTKVLEGRQKVLSSKR